MKMRGYSVLFVCALCVFVLCGAAAVVVAQDETPEVEAAKEARGIADTAKQKGQFALGSYRGFERDVKTVVDELTSAIAGIGASKTTADTLSLPEEVPSKEEIKEDIGKLETTATEAKNAVLALEAAFVASLGSKKEELTSNIADVESKVREAETAAAAVTDNIPTIEAAIEKAGALQKAAKEASALWNVSVQNLTTQLNELGGVFAAVKKTKSQIESAKTKFENNISPETPDLNKELTDVAKLIQELLWKSLQFTRSLLKSSQNHAWEAKNGYTALAAAAEKLKGKAEERRQTLQPAITPAVQPPGETTTILPSATTGGQTPANPSTVPPSGTSVEGPPPTGSSPGGQPTDSTSPAAPPLSAPIESTSLKVTEDYLAGGQTPPGPSAERSPAEELQAEESQAEKSPKGGSPAEESPKGGSQAEGLPKGGSQAEGLPKEGSQAEGLPKGGSQAEGLPKEGSQAEGSPKGGQTPPGPSAPIESTSLKKMGDYSAAPFCSLALPVFFFCWCVLFGM